VAIILGKINLAKSGYKQDMKFENFTYPSIISLATESKANIYRKNWRI
jgi:hypothetical protein